MDRMPLTQIFLHSPMKVEIEITEGGEAFFRIPNEYLVELKWQDGDVIEWIDNNDGSWTLRKSSVASPVN